MARGKRETFIINPLNPKDKVILDFLDKQFNRSEAIRDIIYQYALNNNGNAITMALPHNDNTITIPLSNDDNSITNILPRNDNDIITSLSNNDNNFKIDIDSVDDDVVEIKSEDKNINADKEAINFLNIWR